MIASLIPGLYASSRNVWFPVAQMSTSGTLYDRYLTYKSGTASLSGCGLTLAVWSLSKQTTDVGNRPVRFMSLNWVCELEVMGILRSLGLMLSPAPNYVSRWKNLTTVRRQSDCTVFCSSCSYRATCTIRCRMMAFRKSVCVFIEMPESSASALPGTATR